MDKWIPPDEAERDRIRDDLRTSLLVEAGAGSGKTTAMVGRMVELIRTGTSPVEQIAAVTFTRKAAGELRERFQEELERRFREAVTSGADADRERLQAALSGIDRCFVGTIHSFCGRLLRERPLEAGVPPSFQEISGPEEDRVRAEYWSHFLERLSARDSRLLRSLGRHGLRPAQLARAFREVSDNPDVRYPAAAAPAPSHDEIDLWRRRLAALLDDTLRQMPRDEPEKGWCDLQKKARTLRGQRFHPGWGSDPAFLDSLAYAVRVGHKPTLNRWPVEKEGVKDLQARWDEFAAEDGSASQLVDRWHCCRYPVVLRFVRAASREYARERLRSGRLNFQDLLLLTAQLLRRHPDARRELGQRYRWLLVDEFQDTDPVQAEVIFLLSAEDGHDGHWITAAPRPGALFVVGDPKQSIYRFRRADIAVYNQVKERFRAFGGVLSLVANFRSSPPIETLVERVFDHEDFLPPIESDHQAAFAPLRVEPREWDRPGIRWYRFGVDGRFSQPRMAEKDAAILSSWIAAQVASGERQPGDFMILTTLKAGLAPHARALEQRGVPVEVTGSGVGMEEELEELVLLLRALADPGDGVLTVAVLEGLFFGLSHQDLLDHVRAGGRFDCSRADQPEVSPAAPALQQMNRFWRWTRGLPADAAVPRIVEELGILPHAVAGELGATRAGALLYALDALRTAGLRGECSLPEAVEVLETALAQEVDTPLVPGRSDVVRVMNLHKAKGLEAKVVVLAYPLKAKDHAADRHIRRAADGRATGFFEVTDPTQRNKSVIARPGAWAEHVAEEALYQAAERVRLLYVAATRAAEELVVARCVDTEAGSVWGCFQPVLDDPDVGTEIEIATLVPPAREAVRETVISITDKIRETASRRTALGRPSYRAASVTSRVKSKAIALPVPGAGRAETSAEARGPEWGRAVHQALELAARGVVGHALRLACRGFLVDEGRPLNDHGEPLELEELLALIDALQRSAVWRRSRAALRVVVEAPFAVGFTASEAEAIGVLGAGVERPPREIVEGVIDLAFEEPDGWVIADYKTDVVSDAETLRERVVRYRAQVDLYACCWERLTGQRVKEKVLIFTDTGSEVPWQGSSLAAPSPSAGVGDPLPPLA